MLILLPWIRWVWMYAVLPEVHCQRRWKSGKRQGDVSSSWEPWRGFLAWPFFPGPDGQWKGPHSTHEEVGWTSRPQGTRCSFAGHWASTHNLPPSHFPLSLHTFVVVSSFSKMMLPLPQFPRWKTQPHPDVHSLIPAPKSWGLGFGILTGLQWIPCLLLV